MPRNQRQNEQMRAQSRRKILATARRLFAERGYDGCSVSDIAQHADMSQGNIYWYFPSKEDILKAVLVDGFETLGTVMAQAVEQPGTSIDKLDYLLEHFLALAREQDGEEFVTIVMTLIGQRGLGRLSELGTDTTEVGAGYQDSVSAILAQGQAEGTVAPGVDVSVLTAFFFSFLNGLMFMYPGEWKDIPTETIREAVLRLIDSTRK